MKRTRRGYTIVELMMAISIFGIGVAGIISMEKVTAVSNQHAKNLAIASHIAESWMSMLQADAASWNHPSPGNDTDDLPSTTWLKSTVSNANASSWFLPTYSPVLAFGPAFDALGNPIDTTQGLTGVVFCSHLRLSFLYPSTSTAGGVTTALGNGMIRAEVRVFWLRDGQTSPLVGTNPCAVNMPIASITGATSTFHFVQKISAVRENSTP